MAWIIPKIDWVPGDMVTYNDMNRIGNNINYLMESSVAKDNYTASDYVYLTEWQTMTAACATIKALLEMEEDTPTDDTTAENFIAMETFLQSAKTEIEKYWAQRRANKYAGEGWRVDSEIYVGGNN